MAPKITVPLFITCERCETVKQVKNRSVQRIQRFCSKQCATKACCSHPFHREQQSKGGKVKASRMRAALMLKIGHLGPVEAFRLGYARGLQSKWRKTKAILKARDKKAAA